MLSASLYQDLERIKPARTLVDSQVRSAITAYCNKHSYPFIGRSKAPDSISQKIETGRFSSVLALDDLVAYSIIVPNRSHEEVVMKFLSTSFVVAEIRGRAFVQRNPKEFDFDVTRIYCRLSLADPKASAEFSDKLLFEVQIRTAFEHAWASAVHDEVYKTDRLDLRKIRLSAQIKAQIEILDSLLARFDDESKHVIVSPWRKLNNEIEVIKYIKEFKRVGTVPPELIPPDLIRLSQNIVKILNGKARGNIKKFLDELGAFLDELSSGSFPRSVTLFQIVYAFARKEGYLDLRDGYFSHVSPEAEVVFPELKSVQQRFVYGVVAP